ncbi:unnamed protein product [Ectocarpus fasciculatus]
MCYHYCCSFHAKPAHALHLFTSLRRSGFTMEKENVVAASSAKTQQQKQPAAAAAAAAAAEGESTASSSASSSAAHMFVFSNNKAGMGSVDKERVNRIIYEMSKNSSYFKQAKLQDDKLDQKVAEMRVKLRALDAVRKAQLTRQADKIATELERQRQLDEVCLVIDMDMFYAAVEVRDRPELADKPVAVGGESMISTTNYHARLKGVRSAMPGFIGRKLCPELVFVKPDYEKYTVVAEQIREIFREYDPRMRSYSLDEAYLNVTRVLTERLGLDGSNAPAGTKEAGVAAAAARAAAAVTPEHVCSGTYEAEADTSRRRSMGSSVENMYYGHEEDEEEARDGRSGERRSPRETRRVRLFEAARTLAEEIRARIREATKLTASVGIGPNFMLAKIASDWNKPDGQMCIGGDRAEVLRFLHDLPVRKIGGVGKVQEKCLREALGVVTCGDLFRERASVIHVMTSHTSRWLIKASLGIASADHDVATEQAQAVGAVTRKQISKERTFGELSAPRDLLNKCREICDSLAAEMATKGLEAKTVGLKVKTTKFQVRTQDSTGHAYVSSADDLFSAASALLQREIQGAAASAPGGKLRLRLMGVKASGFRGQAGAPILPGQATLDGFLSSKAAQGGCQGEDGSGNDGKRQQREGDMDTAAGVKQQPLGGGSRSSRPTSAAMEHPFVVAGQGRPVSRPRSKEVLWGVQPATGSPRSALLATSAAHVSCPVCGEQLGAASNAALNRHLDACLGVCAPAGEREGGGVGGGGTGRRRLKEDAFPKKRAKVSSAGIERFLTSSDLV